VTVVNLSQQSESGDLLGGFKPVSVRTLALPMKEEFDDLFDRRFLQRRINNILTCWEDAWPRDNGRVQWFSGEKPYVWLRVLLGL
jgi:midasin